jgi:predicted nucleic acid-binding protein
LTVGTKYEAVLKREIHRQGKDTSVIDKFIDDLVSVANRHSIFYLLRPYLKNADDDFILELAFSSAADYIITYNTDNFKRSKTFGVDVITFYSNYFF